MIYLDYSATTPVNKEVLDTFYKIESEYIGNANSTHKLGVEALNLINASTKQIKELLDIPNHEVIYTSSSSEANNLAIIGICLKYKNRGKHIITSSLEHSSTNEALNYLESIGYEITKVKSTDKGIIDIEDLKNSIREDTILVTINSIDSETGVVEPIDEISSIINNYSKCFLHVDLTQSIGKVKFNLKNIDLASISAHKIYGLKGIAALIKKDNIELESLIHGGKSTTIYRSGTPTHALIASLAKALRLVMEDFDTKYNYVKDLNEYLVNKLKEYKDVYINSNEYSIPHIINISIPFIKAETLQRAFEGYDIYVSTRTACSSTDYSKSVYVITKDKVLAASSIRISLSYLTKKEELDIFLDALNKIYNKYKEL